MKKFISPLLLFMTSILWGFAFIMQKAATTLQTFTLLFLRSLIAVFALIPAVLIFDKITKNNRRLFSFKEKNPGITKREFLSGILCGVLLFIGSAFQQAGIADTDAGKTSFITALYVVIVPIYALFFGKRSPINAWVGIAVAVLGFYLLCIKDGFSVALSDLLIVIGAFAFAMQIMTVDICLPKCDGVRLSLIQFGTMAVLSLIAAIIFESPTDTSDILAVMPEILFLGIGSSGIAYTLQIIGQKNTHPTVASVILSLESVFGAFFSAIILSERMSAREYIGCAAVLAAVIISELDLTKIPKEKKTAEKI